MLPKQKIAKAKFVPFHPYDANNFVVKGAKSRIPTPDPLSAIPVARPLCQKKIYFKWCHCVNQFGF